MHFESLVAILISAVLSIPIPLSDEPTPRTTQNALIVLSIAAVMALLHANLPKLNIPDFPIDSGKKVIKVAITETEASKMIQKWWKHLGVVEAAEAAKSPEITLRKGAVSVGSSPITIRPTKVSTQSEPLPRDPVKIQMDPSSIVKSKGSPVIASKSLNSFGNSPKQEIVRAKSNGLNAPAIGGSPKQGITARKTFGSDPSAIEGSLKQEISGIHFFGPDSSAIEGLPKKGISGRKPFGSDSSGKEGSQKQGISGASPQMRNSPKQGLQPQKWSSPRTAVSLNEGFAPLNLNPLRMGASPKQRMQAPTLSTPLSGPPVRGDSSEFNFKSISNERFSSPARRTDPLGLNSESPNMGSVSLKFDSDAPRAQFGDSLPRSGSSFPPVNAKPVLVALDSSEFDSLPVIRNPKALHPQPSEKSGFVTSKESVARLDDVPERKPPKGLRKVPSNLVTELQTTTSKLQLPGKKAKLNMLSGIREMRSSDESLTSFEKDAEYEATLRRFVRERLTTPP